MYNRYVPQPDGSFRRSRMPDHRQHPPAPKPTPIPEPECPPVPPPSLNRPCEHQHRNAHHKKQPIREDTSAVGFLRKLLPKEFDTGDLMIVLLLLLMAGDCNEDRNTALLTLALYFFM